MTNEPGTIAPSSDLSLEDAKIQRAVNAAMQEMAYLHSIQHEEQLEKLREIREAVVFSNAPFILGSEVQYLPELQYLVNYDHVTSSQKDLFEEAVEQETLSEQVHPAHLVEVELVVETAAKIVGAVFLFSLIIWVFGDLNLINPFFAFLGIIACPFFVAMAKRSRSDRIG